MSKRKLNKFMVLISFIIVMALSSCGMEDTTHRKVSYKSNGSVLDCSAELTGTAKAACAEEYIKRTKDEWVKNCAIANIDEKENLGKRMSDGSLGDKGLKDIDAILKECAYYKVQNGDKELEKQAHNTGYPVFSGFINSAIGSFAGMYMYDALFNKRNKNDDTYSSSTYSSAGTGYVGKNTNTKTGGSNPTNIEKIDTKHKVDNWNIKKMKSTSALKGNYKLGNSGKNWSKFQSASVSRKSTTSSRSSWGSSSSRSSLG